MEERRLGRRVERADLIEKAAVSMHPLIETAAAVIRGEAAVPRLEHGDAVLISSTETIKAVGEETDLTKFRQADVLSASVLLSTWLSEPRTIREFQELKYVLMSMYDDDDFQAVTAFPERRPEILTWGYRSDWLIYENPGYPEVFKIFSNLAGRLKIIQRERMDYENKHEGVASDDQMWRRIEGDKPRENPRAVVHADLDSLVADLEKFRSVNYLKTYTPRIGLVFGDFRVGFHPDHARLAEHAKISLGKDGRLVVITPTANVIREVNHKSPVWEDEIRQALIANDRSVSDVLVSSMPVEYYSHPNDHWAEVWKAVKPDFVYLGETNHPLEPVYRYQSKRIGGILLIDDSISNGIRSGSLLDK